MIVIDTHVLIWLTLAPNRLSTAARMNIEKASEAGELQLASISLWEVAMLVSKGRVQLPTPTTLFLELALQAYDVQVQSITPTIAVESTRLTQLVNQDPADRLIVATALARNAPLVTADRNLRSVSIVPTIW